MPAPAIPKRREALEVFLGRLGYGSELVEFDFPLWTAERRAELVAFARPQPHDMTTSILVGSTESPAASLELARSLAAPFTLVATENGLELWRTAAEARADERIGEAAYDDMDSTARRWRTELKPESILQAKTAFRQLSLFPIDVELLARAEERSRSALGQMVKEAMSLALADTENLGAQAFDSAARLVVGAMAALMLRDKIGLPATEEDTIRHARERWPEQFSWIDELTEQDAERLRTVLDHLGTDVNYGALSPSVVSTVYEQAVVEQQGARRDLGIFYTPPELARQMVEHLPFEALPPDDRVVLDPVCGSGTLLLAAHDRMASVAPLSWNVFEAHDYLRTHLLGFDIDRFAVEIARLALFINAMPAGNHWHIKKGDARKPLHLDRRPTLIVSNPPWRHVRAERREVADEFVRRMVEVLQPGGFMGVVLPATWMASDVSRDVRRYVASEMSIFEMWRLPENTFASSSRLAPCVLLAQKHSPGTVKERPSYLYRRVLNRRGSLDRFFESGAGDVQLLVPIDHASQAIRLPGPLELELNKLRSLRTLGDVAHIQNGPPPRKIEDMSGSGPYRWLRFAGSLTEFGDVPQDALSRVEYPGDFSKRGKSPAVFLCEKVLVSGKRWAENPWRLKVTLDRLGVIPRETLHAVIPRDGGEETLFALLAILGTSVASAWIDTHEPTRNVRVQLLAELPVPDEDHWADLAEVGRALHSAAQAGQPSKDLTKQLEKLAFSAYGIRSETERALRRHFGGFKAPEGRPRFPEIEPSERSAPRPPRRVGGVADVKGNRVRLWVPGLTSEQGDWLNVPDRFFGWLCRRGATFDVYDSDDGLATAKFSYQRRSYRTGDELISREPSW